jgi:hypothetical protein
MSFITLFLITWSPKNLFYNTFSSITWSFPNGQNPTSQFHPIMSSISTHDPLPHLYNVSWKLIMKMATTVGKPSTFYTVHSWKLNLHTALQPWKNDLHREVSSMTISKQLLILRHFQCVFLDFSLLFDTTYAYSLNMSNSTTHPCLSSYPY